MKMYSFTELEKILLIAVKMPTITIKDLAKETGISSTSGLYKWSRGVSHLSPERADMLFKWFQESRPDLLEAAERVFNYGVLENDK